MYITYILHAAILFNPAILLFVRQTSRKKKLGFQNTFHYE